MIVGEGHVNDRLMTCGGHVGQPLRSPTRDRHHWLPCPKVRHGHVFPRNTHAQTRAEGLGTSFFGGPAFGVGACDVFTIFSLALFYISEHTVAKTAPKPIQSALNSFNIRKVRANTKDHGFSLIL